MSVLRLVCWVKKYTLRAWSGRMVVSHCSTKHFLSANTVLLSSLRIDSEVKVAQG